MTSSLTCQLFFPTIGIQIGFSSPQSSSSYDGLPDDDERKSFIVEILNGSFPEDDDRASILLSLEIVDSSGRKENETEMRV